MAGKAKTKALVVPANLTDFIGYLRELVENGWKIYKTEDRLQKKLKRLEAMKKRLKEEAALEKAPYEERIRLLFAAIKVYFMKKKGELLEGDKKSWNCEYATVGERLTGPSVKFVVKLAEIAAWLMKREWGWDFLDVKPSKKKMHADLDRARKIPGVEVQEQRDEFFVDIADAAFEFVRGKLRRKDAEEAEEDEDEAA